MTADVAQTGEGRARRRRRGVRRIGLPPALLAPLAVGLVVVGLWQAGAFHALFGLKTFTVPYPAAIVDGWGDHRDELLGAVGVSVPAALIGFLVGALVGLAVASLLVRYAPRITDRILPFLSATNSLPIVALAPLVALFTGPGALLKVIVVTVMTAPVMTVYAVRGLRNVEPAALELMASLDATSNQVYRMVRLRTALPFVFTALKSCLVLALIGTIVSESVRGFEGLGYIVVDSMGNFEVVLAWLALVVIAALGIGLYLVVEALERVVVPWEAAQRRRG
jgi:NitT/TauT family transport system permease protein